MVRLSFISSVGTGWEAMEHISTPRAADLSEDTSEGARGETSQRGRGREREGGGRLVAWSRRKYRRENVRRRKKARSTVRARKEKTKSR
jgi:hypothetical protein